MTEETPLRLLLVEDNPGDARLIQEFLRDALPGDFHLEKVDRLAAAREALSDGKDGYVVLLDLSLPDAHGLETVRGVSEAAPTAPIIVLTGLDDETVALRTLQEGAQDYLVKGRLEGDLLVRAIRYARERKRLELERAELYQRAREAAAEAEAAALARDEALRIVSHDIGNSLAAVGIHARLLDRMLPRETRDENVSKRIAAIQQLVDQMETLRGDLLDVARIEAGHMSLDPERHNVGDLVSEAVELISEVADHQRVRLEFELDRDLPIIVADRGRILQLLGNLLGNALKFTPAGGRVRIGAEQVEDEVRITVADTGSGIPAEDLPHLFDRYWQARSSRRAGAGLGLAIARGIVEAHGGWIRAESEVGVGTTFTVTLPLEGPGLPNDQG